MIARARAAQALVDGITQQQADDLALACAWAIMEPARNRALAERAVQDTGLGNVADKITKNHRKTLGLMRDLQYAKTVGVIAEYPARGVVERTSGLARFGATGEWVIYPIGRVIHRIDSRMPADLAFRLLIYF